MRKEAECVMKTMCVLNKKRYIKVDEYKASVEDTYKKQLKLAHLEKLEVELYRTTSFRFRGF